MKLESLKDYAKQNNVPIITDEGLAFICDYIIKHDVKKILEIGSAIGYSAINFSLTNSCEVFTIERSETYYNIALENIKDNGLDTKIHIEFCDALEFDDTKLDKEYDLLFIDAAKAQYEKFLLKYSPYLKEDGAIICDNLAFHGLTEDPSKLGRNLRQLVTKINRFKKFLRETTEFETEFFEVGDGMSISKKVKK